MKGAAALYTRDYFELARSRLNPGGVITQWVPLYESTSEVVKSEIATFFEAFPDGVIWGNTKEGEGYDLVLEARLGGLTIDIDALATRLASPGYERVGQSLAEASFGSTLDLLATYAGRASDLQPWTADAEINRDSSLRLQYLAGLHLNRYEQAEIFAEILQYRSYPEELFTGSEDWTEALREAMRRGWY
jgi:spermidine synthase